MTTPEKETPTPKTVEEVVHEQTYIMHPNYPNDSFITKKDLERILVAQNQAADEQLREVFAAILEEQTTFDNYNNTQTYAGVLVADIRRIAKEHGITNL